jgi:hypothetical protein
LTDLTGLDERISAQQTHRHGAAGPEIPLDPVTVGKQIAETHRTIFTWQQPRLPRGRTGNAQAVHIRARV